MPQEEKSNPKKKEQLLKQFQEELQNEVIPAINRCVNGKDGFYALRTEAKGRIDKWISMLNATGLKNEAKLAIEACQNGNKDAVLNALNVLERALSERIKNNQPGSDHKPGRNNQPGHNNHGGDRNDVNNLVGELAYYAGLATEELHIQMLDNGDVAWIAGIVRSRVRDEFHRLLSAFSEANITGDILGQWKAINDVCDLLNYIYDFIDLLSALNFIGVYENNLVMWFSEEYSAMYEFCRVYLWHRWGITI